MSESSKIKFEYVENPEPSAPGYYRVYKEFNGLTLVKVGELRRFDDENNEFDFTNWMFVCPKIYDLVLCNLKDDEWRTIEDFINENWSTY